jgi:hypothetical protein
MCNLNPRAWLKLFYTENLIDIMLKYILIISVYCIRRNQMFINKWMKIFIPEAMSYEFSEGPLRKIIYKDN